MKKVLLITLLTVMTLPGLSFGQTVNYDIMIGSTVGLTLTSGDICTAPFNIEEARQTTIGNEWGATWMSTNGGNALSIQIELMFTNADNISSYPTTLNGIANNSVNPGGAVNCSNGTQLLWNIDPTNYIPMGSNTFLVNYAASAISNQLENLIYAGDPYMRVTVNYSGLGLDELNSTNVELVKITDLMGRETVFKPNTPLIYVYSDGTVRRVFQMEGE